MRPIALLVAVAALVGCRSIPPIDETPAVVVGRVEGAERIPRGAVVQVYRIEATGLPSPEPFETVEPDKLGRFRTRALAPGRYRFAYRSGDGPPSVASARVPDVVNVVLHPLVLPGLVGLRATTPSIEFVACKLTEAKAADGVPDVRQFRCWSREPASVRGLRPGAWRLDLPELGATTEVELPSGEAFREVIVDPPAIAGGGTLVGEVRRIDGSPAAWMTVTARPLSPTAASATRWGRYGVTDRAGRYRIVGIPPGQTLVRVECREAPLRVPPSAQVISIPPAGTAQLGFVAEY
jgi:hypothetical protein